MVVFAPPALCAIQHTTNSLIEVSTLNCVSTCTAVRPRHRSDCPVSLRWGCESVRGRCLCGLGCVLLHYWSGGFRHDHLRRSGFLDFVHLKSGFLSRGKYGAWSFCLIHAHLEGSRERQDHPKEILCLQPFCGFCRLSVV